MRPAAVLFYPYSLFSIFGVILAGSPENASKYYARGHTLVPPSYSKFSGPKLSGKSSAKVNSL